MVDNINNLHSRAPLTPRGVYDLRVADSKSIAIYFVALCRTFGVAARLNPETRIPQYFDSDKWINVSLDDKKEIATRKGFVHLVNKTTGFMPRYAKHFSICVFKDGTYTQLDFDEDKKLSDFPENLELDYGEYILVTGNRMDDGSVLSTMDFFKVSDKIENVVVKVRANRMEEKMYGQIDLNSFNLENYSTKKALKLNEISKEKGSLLIFIDPDKEPTKHVMNDIPPYSDIFDKWPGGIAFILSKEKTSSSFNPNNYSKLPKQSIFAYDNENKLVKSLEQTTGKPLSTDYPIIIILDKSGRIIYLTTGYRIGTGEQLSREISVMK